MGSLHQALAIKDDTILQMLDCLLSILLQMPNASSLPLLFHLFVFQLDDLFLFQLVRLEW
jgi:hypothetical protein